MRSGLYKHFKGNPYRVYGTAQHSETKELYVRYKSLKYQSHWIRPHEMFNSMVSRDGYQGPRFVREPWWKQLLYFWKR